MAERMVSRRQSKDMKFEIGKVKRRRVRTEKEALQELSANIRESRAARRDAWHLGPLAPKLDLGTGDYAVMQSPARRAPSLQLRPQEIRARCAWAGGPEYLNLIPKDRVVVLEGPDRGKIDVVKSIHMDTATLQLETISTVRRLDPMSTVLPAIAF